MVFMGMKILGTGLTGLVGSRIVELLKDDYRFESSEIDITDRKNIFKKVKESESSLVLHLAAKTDVDRCELDKPLGEKGEAWKINVLGTQNIADACLQTNKKLIYISTDFVFDGVKNGDGYREEDVPNPINWYARTKYEGEKIVQLLPIPWTIVRIAFPYRAKFQRLDFARAILSRLREGKEVNTVTDQIFTPTFIDDIAFALNNLLKSSLNGIYHVVGSQNLSPYDAAVKIADIFGADKSLISKTTRKLYFKDKAPRPFCLAVKNDKIKRLGIKMKTFEEGIREIQKQLMI